MQRCEILIGSIKTLLYIPNQYTPTQVYSIEFLNLVCLAYACGLSLRNLVVALSSLTWSTSRTHYINGCVCITPSPSLTHCSRTSRSTQSEEVSHPLSIPHTVEPWIWNILDVIQRAILPDPENILFIFCGDTTTLGYDPSWLMTVLVVPYTPAYNTNSCHEGWMDAFQIYRNVSK